MTTLEIIMTSIGGATALIGTILVPLEIYSRRRRKRELEAICQILDRHRRWIREYLGGEEKP